ncbi:chemotaxis protein CheC [Mangrovibacillus cuniculi]|uniref:Chemotaxis protein CheC n=1 Tax=Mangrovibacillus cuniculi TaxID=2593652 RepID=A0A7S8CE95_9BACI|nr:chemotaxis protein CheC [Mangrovibacillus cuniculi]QPC48361.1 chemotaxis protein CheC [Mangrovibacillus cuniculi]
MDNLSRITSFQLEVLKEIGNIGAGHSATALSTLLGRKIDMKVPSVQVVSFDEMMEMAGGPDNIVVSVFLRIEGDAPGSMFFVLSLEQASRYIQQMTGEEDFSFSSPPYSEIGLSAMQELGNILSGSYLSSLSDFTNLSLFPSVPGLSIDMVGAIISYGLIELSQSSDMAIVINTTLTDDDNKNDNSLNGHFFLLPDPDSFAIMFSALGVDKHE